MKKYKAYVISHTHWDREWYQTFQQYRRRLVRMMDGLIDGLEKDQEYKHFHLDGQTIVLEDYLRIRPEKKERLFKLIRDGRISIGPWYVMPDEFLVSGEALIVNIQKGISICEEIGVEPMMSGYVTDIFGHNSQFPQVLNGFGIKNTVLYRGIADYPKDRFIWEAADGSQVEVAKLDNERCYSNFYYALRWPYDKLEYSDEDLIRRAEMLIERTRELAAGDVMLMMDGVDHAAMEHRLPHMLKVLNEHFEDVEFIHASLNEYNEACTQDGAKLETLKGPLYHLGYEGIYNQVLRNVLSSIIQLKQANDRCETKLSRIASPLEALIYQNQEKLAPETLEHTMLPYSGYRKEAWEYLLKNQPHDSICGCSISEVHMDNEYRFRQCEQIADMLTEESLDILARNISCDMTGKNGGFLLYNAGQKEVDTTLVVTVEIPGNIGWNFSLYDAEGKEAEYQLISAEPYSKRISKYDKLIEFESEYLVSMALKARVPRFGYTVFTYDKNQTVWGDFGDYLCKKVKQPYRMLGTLRTGVNTFDNGVMTVEVNPNGSLNVTDKRTGKVYQNLLTFEDGGDWGDGWNYRKPVFDRQFMTGCSNCDFSVVSDGKYAAVFVITHRMTLPNYPAEGSLERIGVLEVMEFETTVTLKKDSYRMDFKTRIKNNMECHRLRVLFPTGMDTDHYYTATPFDMQKWNVAKEDCSRYMETETFVTPSQGITFLTDGKDSCALYSVGLYEVEVMDRADRALALTLFRAYMYETNLPEAKRNLPDMKMNLTFDYAWDLEPASPEEAQVLADGFRCGMLSAPLYPQEQMKADEYGEYTGSLNGELPSCTSLAAAGNEAVLSTMYAENEKETILRFVNYYDRTVTESFTLNCPIESAELIDFGGNILESLEVVNGTTVKVPLDAHKVVTVKVVRDVCDPLLGVGCCL